MTPLQKKALYGGFAAIGFVLGLAASGCLSSTVVCNANLKACGTTCADITSDKANCGGCGIACAVGQVCQNSACVCETGTELCNGACVVTQTDPQNCGACGQACPSGQVCEAGACKTACTLGGTSCNNGCVDLQNDPNNCGACGNACNSGQTCHAGTCSFDVVAACYDGATLVGIQSATASVVTQVGFGTSPFLLAPKSPVVLVADQDGTLRQAALDKLTQVGSGNPLSGSGGAAPDVEGLLSASPYVYVLDDGNNALTVFQGPNAGTLDGGYPLTAVGGYSFEANSGARSPALLGNVLYVPLSGNLFAGAPGTRVARVDVSNPGKPQDAGVIDLSGLPLQSFDGGTAYAQPNAATVFNGKVYVALSNLDPSYAPAGPGLLAKIDPASGAVTEVNLGSDVCLAPYALTPVGNQLVVSCAGATDYTNYPVVTTSKSGLVLVNANDQRVGAYPAACPAPADGGCIDPSLGNVAASGQRVYAADQSAGRMFVVDVSDAGFTEVRGYGADGGPLQLCVGADGGTAGQLVSDVTAIP